MNIIPVVKSYPRTSAKGKRVTVPRHYRRRKTRTKNPVKPGNPSIKVSSAEYESVIKLTSIAIVDEDDNKINSYMHNIPMKVNSVVVDEQGNLGLKIQSKSKRKQITSVHIEQPKDF